MSVTFGLAKSRHFYHILLYMSMCIFVYIFDINNTAKGNTSLMLNKLLLLLIEKKRCIISDVHINNPWTYIAFCDYLLRAI